MSDFEPTLIADAEAYAPAAGVAPEHRCRVRVWDRDGELGWTRIWTAFRDPEDGEQFAFYTSRGLHVAEGRSLGERGLVREGGNLLDALAVETASGDECLGPAELEALRQVARHRGHEPRECGLPSVADSFRGAAVRDAGQTAGEDGMTDE